jgi:hypothetical protein
MLFKRILRHFAALVVAFDIIPLTMAISARNEGFAIMLQK